MKICGISDIHGNLLKNVPECDVLCIAGDVITLNAQRNFDASEYWWKNRFVPWVMGLPCKKVLVVPGNHDIYLENLYVTNKWEEFCDYMAITTEGKLHFLIDQSYEYEGIKFYGTPWIEPIDFQRNKWAFENYNPNHDNPYSKIPECDVLITHDNPIENELLNIESWNQCRYHFYGHWHDGESIPEKGKYNCSRLNNYYSFKKDFEYPTINIEPMKTEYRILIDYLTSLLNEMIEGKYDESSIELIKSKIALIEAEEYKYLQGDVKFVSPNSVLNVEESQWDDSSIITDMYDDTEEYDEK